MIGDIMDKKLLKGTFVITFGILISKFLSLFFIFPFSHMVGPIGLSLYSYAYIPYTLFLDISTLGIPLGIAKVISMYGAMNKHNTIKKLLKVTLICMLFISIIAFLGLNLISGTYAKMVLGNDSINSYESVKKVINIISLAILIIPFVSVFRGYFQGKRKMFVLSISQIIEQVIRVSFILITSYMFYQYGYEKPVNMAVFAAFVAGLGSLLVLLIFFFKEKKEKSNEEVNIKEAFKLMLKYAIPFALVGLNLALYNLADSMFFNRAYGLINSEEIYGIFSFEVQRLINIPIALAIGLSINIMPSITSSLIKGEKDKIEKQITSSYHMIFMITLPVVLLCMLYSNNIYQIFYHNNIYGGKILFYSAPLILFYSLNNITNSMMQGLNKGKRLIINIFIGLSLKFLLNFFFIKALGYQGAILLTIISMLIVMLLNLWQMRNYINSKKIFFSFSFLLAKNAIPIILVYTFFRFINWPNILFLSASTALYFLIYGVIIRDDIHTLIIGEENGKEGTV